MNSVEPRGFMLREAFHLALLKMLAAALSNHQYAVKGGVCLRLFHRSPRLSEDLDLDVTGIPVASLKSRIGKLLEGRSLLQTLQPLRIARLTYSAPKQTETTQRWKVRLILGDGGSLPTRIECSRRTAILAGVETGVPSAAILQAHQLTPFACCHYGVETMITQKIAALAAPSRSACRDLFDLHHLIFHGSAGASLPLSQPATGEAIAKIETFQYDDFCDQVLPFLPPDLADLYREVTSFERMKQTVLEKLK